MNRFVYIIYDEFTAEVFAFFDNEDDCINRYIEQYQGFINVNWGAFNLSYILKNFYHIGEN